MAKEKIRLISVRAYFLMSCHRFWNIRSDKDKEESLIIELTNNGGYIEFELTNSTSSEVTKIENPETGVYTFPLAKGALTKLICRAKGAKGSYKIQKKTIIE